MKPIILILIGIMSAYTFECFKSIDNHISINYEIQSNKSEEESFKNFLRTFSSDSLFQMNHIHFPLKYTSVDILDNKEEILIQPHDWKMLKFDNNSETEKRNIDAYKQLIEISYNSAKVLLRGIDNGINIEFIFDKKNGTWLLIEWNDNSV